MPSDQLLFETFPALQQLSKSPKEALRAARLVGKMKARFGPGPAETQCRECTHLKHARQHDASYLKCARYGDTRSTASDWRAKWPACGAFARKGEK